MESINKGKGKVDDEELWVERLNKDGSNEQDQDSKLRCSIRVRHSVQILTYDSFMVNHFAYMSQVIKVEEPCNFEEAEKKQEWQEAMDEEMLAIRENGTWTLVPRNKEIKPIGCKWFYKIKLNSNGTIAGYKARYHSNGKLKNALQGLKQALRVWYHKLVLCLMNQEFKESDVDPLLFDKCKGNEILVICIYVDDLIITCDNEECIKDIKAELKSEFKISDLGELSYFLGIEIT